MGSEQRHRRSREGCWTCRRRKKKCDGSTVPCGNCSRLGLYCERDIRLVWEDDSRREAMKNRGPVMARLRKQSNDFDHLATPSPIRLGIGDSGPLSAASFRNSIIGGLPTWPFELDATETLLLDHYIQKFSKTYPTFSAPTNPFLTVLLPLSTQNRVVLDALLSLSAVQTWKNGSFVMRKAMLKMRQKALQGCQQLLVQLSQSQTEPDGLLGQGAGDENATYLFASCMLLLLYEKLTGEGQDNWSAHLSFFSRFYPPAGVEMTSRDDTVQFLLNLFLYNDLVRSTSLQTTTLSDFYLREVTAILPQIPEVSTQDRFTFPRLIARISAADTTVTDSDIAAWDGSLNWLPSFALVTSQNSDNQSVFDDGYLTMDNCCHSIQHLIPAADLTDEKLASRLYRMAAMVYRRQRLSESQSSPNPESISSKTLALWAVQVLKLIPEFSAYENTLLWPIGIIAKELTLRDEAERAYIISRLQALERGFCMKHFDSVKDFLLRYWKATDQGMTHNHDCTILLG
ncbi:fungal-specific transcription factor domain-containing protein [Aspergillus egyptiacus]|nr:fungal-specific transcription factor domain-containing protein [Aspergillus egyptiacus]